MIKRKPKRMKAWAAFGTKRIMYGTDGGLAVYKTKRDGLIHWHSVERVEIKVVK